MATVPQVWLITGCSTGFGYELAKYALAQGDRVVATARKPEQLSFGDAATDSNYLGLALDVTQKTSIQAALDAAVHKFGHVDIVVNNAGYGLCGEFEALSDEQCRTQMEVNFFGVVDVTRAALPLLRRRSSSSSKAGGGLIMQVTSIGGQRGVPLFSIYCASKWAVEGFTESIDAEVKPDWGIKFCCVEPGGFRTDWAGRSMIFADSHSDYDHLDAREKMTSIHGKQGGDPAKAAKAMYQLGHMPRDKVPLRIVLGSDAVQRMHTKLDTYTQNVQRFEQLSRSTDVD